MAGFVGPDDGNLNREAAEAILKMRFQPTDARRMSELAQKNGADLLTPTERAELDTYLRVGMLLDLMQAKARVSLKNHNGPK